MPCVRTRSTAARSSSAVSSCGWSSVCFGEGVALRVHDDALALAGGAGAVDADHKDLVDDGVGLGEDQFLFAVRGGGFDDVEDHLGAHPGELAGDLGEPGVVADVQAHPADAGQVHGGELVAGVVGLERAPGEDLPVVAGELPFRGQDQLGVEQLPFRAAFADAAGDQPDVEVFGELLELFDPGAVQRFGTCLEHFGSLQVRVFIAEEVQLGEDDQLAVRLGFEGCFDLVGEGRDGFADEPRPGLGGDEGKDALHGFVSALGCDLGYIRSE